MTKPCKCLVSGENYTVWTQKKKFQSKLAMTVAKQISIYFICSHKEGIFRIEKLQTNFGKLGSVKNFVAEGK